MRIISRDSFLSAIVVEWKTTNPLPSFRTVKTTNSYAIFFRLHWYEKLSCGGKRDTTHELISIGMKQMGHSSFGGGSLKRASSRSKAAGIYIRFYASPMLPLAFGVTIPSDKHTQLTLFREIPPATPHSAQQ